MLIDSPLRFFNWRELHQTPHSKTLFLTFYPGRQKSHNVSYALRYQIPSKLTPGIKRWASYNIFALIFLSFSVPIISIKFMCISSRDNNMNIFPFSWRALSQIWLVGHLSRHELWEQSCRQCNFTGNIWAEIYKLLGEGLLLPRWLPKFLILALWKWDREVNQISMNDDVGTLMYAVPWFIDLY